MAARASASGCRREYFVAGHGARRRGARSARRSRRSRRRARRSRRSASRTPTTASPRTTSSRRRRPRPTSPATTASATGYSVRGGGDYLAELPRDPRRGLRRRGQAPDHARHVRAVGRLLRRVLPQGAEGPDADQARLRPAVGAGLRRPRRARPRRPSRSAFGARMADPVAMYLSDACTLPVNMAGLPGVSVPCGLSEGLPVGLQLIGAAWSEAELFRAARAYEAITAGAAWRRLEPARPRACRRPGRAHARRARRGAAAAPEPRSARDPDRVPFAHDDRPRDRPRAARRARARASASAPCRRRASAGSSTSSPRWTTSSASGWGSPTSTPRARSSRRASRACARAGPTTPRTSAPSSSGGRCPRTSSACTASATTRRPRSSSPSARPRPSTSPCGRPATRATR